ncbi:MAG: hypothetical protein ACR2QQ_14480 [Gammaproteobacteria bacterium]
MWTMEKNYPVAATLVLVLLGQSASAQEPRVDLSGIWWSGAPVPLLPGETAPPAMGMGMGGGMGSSSSLMLTAHGTDLMADFDPADDPAVVCVQSGLARTITSPYPLEIVQSGDTATIEYEEWEVLRTIHIGGSIPDNYEPNPLGYSIGQYEDGALIVTSTGATEGLARIGDFFTTSEEMTTVERYSLTERGQLRLDLEIIDPVMLSEPLRWERTWNPYDQPLLDFDCILRER